MRIDVHNHYYPPRFLELLEREGPAAGISVEKDEWGRRVIVQNGNRVVTLTPPMTDIGARLEDMKKAGVDMQILSLSVPSVDLFPAKLAGDLARAVNEEIAEICRKYPEHFMGFATLPFRDPERAVEELDRGIQDPCFCGACMGTNIRGIGLDHPSLHPFYQRISELDLPVHIHPRAPADRETYGDYRLVPMIGFEMELCVAVVRLVMGGILDLFPGTVFIVSHLGGAVPYLAERINTCYKAYPECRGKISGPPMEYLKRLYYDTVSFFEPALMCARSLAGSDHMILGSDYPHVIGDIERAITSIESLNIPHHEKEMIYSGNILRLIHKSERG